MSVSPDEVAADQAALLCVAAVVGAVPGEVAQRGGLDSGSRVSSRTPTDPVRLGGTALPSLLVNIPAQVDGQLLLKLIHNSCR